MSACALGPLLLFISFASAAASELPPPPLAEASASASALSAPPSTACISLRLSACFCLSAIPYRLGSTGPANCSEASGTISSGSPVDPTSPVDRTSPIDPGGSPVVQLSCASKPAASAGHMNHRSSARSPAICSAPAPSPPSAPRTASSPSCALCDLRAAAIACASRLPPSARSVASPAASCLPHSASRERSPSGAARASSHPPALSRVEAAGLTAELALAGLATSPSPWLPLAAAVALIACALGLRGK
mmetsp:Transcript_26478/g.61789  ORF Transcript_26478/g.61789 Transcript_26478/m.61789 type:complete len:249 (-) Transcript_26478:1888-2634(-)